jgi:hypothetical protein
MKDFLGVENFSKNFLTMDNVVMLNMHKFCNRSFLKYTEVVGSVQFCDSPALPSITYFVSKKFCIKFKGPV